jgi:hypothetical protein
MPMEGVIRAMILTDIAALAVLGIGFLLSRRLPWWQTCLWGILALGVPLLGPFLVISLRPQRK